MPVILNDYTVRNTLYACVVHATNPFSDVNVRLVGYRINRICGIIVRVRRVHRLITEISFSVFIRNKSVVKRRRHTLFYFVVVYQQRIPLRFFTNRYSRYSVPRQIPGRLKISPVARHIAHNSVFAFSQKILQISAVAVVFKTAEHHVNTVFAITVPVFV